MRNGGPSVGEGVKAVKKRKGKMFKTKWALKGLTWKLISIPLGAGVVHWLTGELQLAWDYLLVYTPISLLCFFLHEMAWQWWKLRKRKKLGIAVVEMELDNDE